MKAKYDFGQPSTSNKSQKAKTTRPPKKQRKSSSSESEWEDMDWIIGWRFRNIFTQINFGRFYKHYCVVLWNLVNIFYLILH